jgi:hypothetical protein
MNKKKGSKENNGYYLSSLRSGFFLKLCSPNTTDF